ncbi:aminotransferase class I/II-fold pyridoxal phosphate-dependent enzyme [Brevibacterium album]|uniref:aminotransferase class I/II-fold pyridoxal phosphate-dependent enzyme n=1 Tax=Brevibacterium album TaxID=417948 RepID=UPI0003FCBFF3
MSASDGTAASPSPAELSARLEQAGAEYERLASLGLALDITRGKPSAAQLDLSNPLLTAVDGESFRAADGTDTRNYGGAEGLPELREIFAPLLQAPPGQLLAQGNSSLTLMKDALTFALLHGRPDSPEPWARTGAPVRMLCPAPGYDRHFGLAESLGFELVPVDADAEGPDLEQVATLTADPSVKGIWLVPVHSNPTGVSLSAERTRALMALETAAPDFTVMWDNAYALHHLREPHPEPVDVLGLAREAGHPDRPLVFASTSKITHAGAGVAFFAASERMTEWFLAHTGAGSIGPDKVNQLRHARFFGSSEGVLAHMRRHAELLAPKFAAVDAVFARVLGPEGLAAWTNPGGGYFITLAVRPGTASRVVKLAGEAGVKLTPAGATHPYGLDPDDAIIRIAPSMPPLEEVEAAAEVVAACVRLAAYEAVASGA